MNAKKRDPRIYLEDILAAIALIGEMITSGKDLASAKMVSEIYEHSISVMDSIQLESAIL